MLIPLAIFVKCSSFTWKLIAVAAGSGRAVFPYFGWKFIDVLVGLQFLSTFLFSSRME